MDTAHASISTTGLNEAILKPPLFGEQYAEDVTASLGTHKVLRYRVGRDSISSHGQPSELKPGKKLNQPGPLFKKLEESVVEEERARLGR